MCIKIKLRMIYPALQHGAWELSTFKAIIFRFELFWLSVLPSMVPTIERILFNVKVEHLGASYILDKWQMTKPNLLLHRFWYKFTSFFLSLEFQLELRERAVLRRLFVFRFHNTRTPTLLTRACSYFISSSSLWPLYNEEMNGIPLFLLRNASFVGWQIIRHASKRVDYLVQCVKYLA